MGKILCIDFDGVIHSYKSGWKGIDIIPDPPVKGAIEWICEMVMESNYCINIYSSRSKTPEGIVAMKRWMFDNISATDWDYDGITQIIEQIDYPTQKPPAYLTIDDRAICFRGTFPSIQELDNFMVWNK